MLNRETRDTALVGLMIVITLAIPVGAYLFRDWEQKTRTREVVRQELDKTYVDLPDGSRIYFQSGEAKKR